MATIISTAVKLLLDSTGFQAGVATAVSVASAAQAKINTLASASASVGRSLASSLSVSGVMRLSEHLEKIHPMVGLIGTAFLLAATQINFCTVAQNAWTAATMATTAATTALMAVGLPMWGAVAVLIGVAVVAVVGLVAAYQSLSGALGRSAEEAERLARAEAIRASEKKRNADIEKTIAEMEVKLAGLGLSNIQKQLVNLEIIKGANAEQMKRAKAVLEETEQRERQAEVMKSIAELEKQADQMGMSDLEKKLSDLADLGAKPEQIEAIKQKMLAAQAEVDAKQKVLDMEKQQAQWARERFDREVQAVASRASQAAALKNSLMTPMEAYEKKIQDIENLRKVNALDSQTAERAGAAAMAELQKKLVSDTGRNIAGPKFMSKGSYEDEIAKNRQQTPIEKMTEIQKKQLEEAQKQLEELRRISKATEDATDELVQAQF